MAPCQANVCALPVNLLNALFCLQEEDVIGIMPEGDKIATLKPLGDRILIKVSNAA
jgi:hypothetical protein